MEYTLASLLILVLIGAIAGIAAGFIGIGGGVIMVPVLIELFRYWGVPAQSLVQAAMATSLAVATFSVASSALKHHKQGNVLWRLVPSIAPASMVGGWAAAVIAKHTAGEWLQIGLATVLLLAAIKMLLEQKVERDEMRKIPWWGWMLIGFVIGLFSGLTGLAGGLALIPAMTFIAHIPTKKLAGTSSGVVMFTALASAVGYMTQVPAAELGPGFIGHSNLLVSGCLALTAVPAAQLGAYLNKRAESVVYKRIFSILLILVVIRLYMTV